MEDIKKEVLGLIQSGCYDMVQRINGGPEEYYEGCTHNLYMILTDPEPTAEVVADDDPAKREGKTYRVKYDTFMAKCEFIIWEVEWFKHIYNFDSRSGTAVWLALSKDWISC